MVDVRADELEKVPYLDISKLDGRIVPLQPLWTGTDWDSWIPVPQHGLLPMRIIDVANSLYYGHVKAKEDDLHIPFIELLTQRATWKDLRFWIDGLHGDVLHLTASLAKIDHFWQCRGAIGHGVAAFVATEVMQLFTTSRRTFDDLQELIGRLSTRAGGRRPKGFAKVVLVDEGPVGAEAIAARWRMPLPLAHAYARSATFFQHVRSYRDQFVHGGKGIQNVFVADKSFAIGRDDAEFAFLDHDRDDHVEGANLRSLRPALARLAWGTIAVCNDIVQAASECYPFGTPIAPGLSVFLRAEHAGALASASKVLGGACPFWDPVAPGPITSL